MALSTIENKIVQLGTYSTFLAGTGAVIFSAAYGHHVPSLMAASTLYASIAGVAGAGYAYDHLRQKHLLYKMESFHKKAVKTTEAHELFRLAHGIQRLEHALEHRLNVLDKLTPKAQQAMGFWITTAAMIVNKMDGLDLSTTDKMTWSSTRCLLVKKGKQFENHLSTKNIARSLEYTQYEMDVNF